MSTSALKRYTVAEYLAFERASDTKHEFYDGEIFEIYAMAGASSLHNLIVGNSVTALNIALRERDCLVFPSDMRVRTPSGLYTYPDVSAVCGPPTYEDDRNDTLLNPLVIFEVLSPSTEAYDRGRKFDHYTNINSLQEYVLVAQDRPSVHHYARQGGKKWLVTTFSELDESVPLPALDCSLAMAEIYLKVAFPPENEQPGEH